MKTRLLLLAAAAATTAGCYDVASPAPSGVGSFRVTVQNVSAVTSSGTLQPLDVETSCIKRYGVRTEQVPMDARGKTDCRYVAPLGQVEMLLDVTALDKAGKPYDFNGPITFKVVPGDLSDSYNYFWVKLARGRGQGKLRARHVYGEVRVWAVDEPVEPNYTDGGIAGDATQLPVEPESRSYAAGTSSPIYFEEPSLASVQRPEAFDNRTSPFVGQFVTIGRAPEAGPALYHDCPAIDRNGDGKPDPQDPQPMTLVVTGTDPSGFYVTDITSCPVPEDISTASGVSVPEPSGFLPGTYGSMFIYNYSYPEGLDPGDLLWTLSGSVQEFTGTTQLTFPSWTVRERVRQLPPDQWTKYLQLVPPVEVNLRHCALSDKFDPFITDALCGYNNKNLKMESLESALVKIRHVRFPQVFKTCDLNGDGTVPQFCQTKDKAGNWLWGNCDSSGGPDPDAAERQCSIDCTIGQGAYANTVCSERTQFTGYGQFVVEMTSPGPREAGLDDTLPQRVQEVSLSNTTSQKISTGYTASTAVILWCEADAYLHLGDATSTASTDDPVLPAKTRREVILGAKEGYVSFLATQPVSGTPRCYVSANSHTRILLTTTDAVPDLKVDCDEKDADATRAQQCRNLHGAFFDVVGHLHQVQAARPRWQVLPRDVDDFCCYPGPGLECPKPIKPCP